jgi:hypothetical protein
VVNSIKNWQKDNYHKQMLQLKEKKDMDDQFKKAQKPWAKMLEKVEKCKLNYHIACKNEKTAVNQERNATKDSSLSQDQVRREGGGESSAVARWTSVLPNAVPQRSALGER